MRLNYGAKKQIISGIMEKTLRGKAKRIMVTAVAILMAAVYCCSFAAPAESYEPGGSISGRSHVESSSSVFAFTPSVLHEGSSNAPGQQNFERSAPSNDLFSRLARRVLQTAGSAGIPGSLLRISFYYYLLCASFCAAFCGLAHVRFIHSQDGSK